ncbi:nuclease-related domain-containing DEAD/DEAH box helicase [Leifsonia sp. Leaf336]|uniref:nuclease-related domain-containing DEAD/DEAH box helicase n=1 Tax=Leifsonia sp. Leaf336 TaxID=1736341 RepID=UPI000AC360A6|nr:NERD domain-containing protein [Leifsonia sp. Leaf336]
MARMIPAYCVDTAPPGEKSVFAALQNAPGTEHWTVLHSLGIAQHKRQVEGEADFIVIVPRAGLLVVEVKSHRSVERLSDGRWRLGRDAPTARSPFQQAQGAMYSIREYLLKKRVDLRDVPTLYAVWFTGVRARTSLPDSPEWHDWQVLDSQDLPSAFFSVKRVMSAGAQHLSATLKHFGNNGLGPDGVLANKIAQLLRPRFEIVSTPSDRRRAREGQLAQFVEEQFRALDAAADNKSVLFTGPAGTGKTFLAVETAQREIAQGRSGRLLCFNRFLGRSLRDKFSDTVGLGVSTLHQEMLRLAGLGGPPDGAGSDFWERELPDRALDGLASRGSKEVGDFLIIDEVQDIATDAYLDLLDFLVVGGLREGRVLLFGDFERQAIYANEEGRERLRSRAPHLASIRLLENCRNLPRIGYEVNLLGHLEPGFKEFRRNDDGIDPVIVRYSSGDDQSALLKKAISDLRDEGFDLSEIVVLSPLGESSVAASTSDPWLRQVLRPADGKSPSRGELRFSTIHAFKGLDAPAVVVTDLVDSGASNFDALLYVGLTRATDRLTVLVETSTLRQLLGGRL